MIFFDFETTNLDYGNADNLGNRIVMVAWCVDNGPMERFYGNILEAEEFWKDLNSSTDACAFNCKFEIKWLKRLGFDVDALKWHDPMLAEKVLLGNEQAKMGLDAVCQRYGCDTKDQMIDTMMKNGICPSEMPQKRLMARCVRDVRTTRAIHYSMLEQLDKNNQIHLYRNRCDFAVVLAHIESEGMLLDKARVNTHYSRYAKQLAELERDLDKMTGGINLNSSDQKAEFLYGKLKFPEKRGANKKPLRNSPSKRWPDGKPKTDKATMQWLATQAKTDEQKLFVSKQMQYSKAKAALTKNLEFFKGVIEERDSRFHAQFNQTVAATHRLTSSGVPIQFRQWPRPKSVQFQNMPREFKECFTAPQGYLISEVDAMQLEFRVAAFLGQDKQAMADIADPDFDAHCRTASIMQGIPYEQFLSKYRAGVKQYKVWRQMGKPDTFKPLYGGTRGTPEQERYYASFAERYAGVSAEQENWLAEVLATGKLTTPWGMTFKWDVYMNSNGMAMNKKTHKPVGPQVFNYPVQNLATAEIVPIAITTLYRRIRDEGLDVKLVNTIHDSVIAFVKDDPETIRRYRELASECFTTAVYDHLKLLYGIDFNVPLGMEMVIGKFWGEGEEFIYDDVDNRKEQ